jgi:phage tail-like protein
MQGASRFENKNFPSSSKDLLVCTPDSRSGRSSNTLKCSMVRKPAPETSRLVQTKTQGDFNLSNRFSFEIDGVLVAGVHTIDGLESESDVVEYIDPADGVSHIRPGNHQSQFRIKKDWSNTSEFFAWRKAVLDGKVDRRSISVVFHNDAGEEAGRYNFYNCWPSKWVGPSLNARSSCCGTERVTFVFETMDNFQPPI